MTAKEADSRAANHRNIDSDEDNLPATKRTKVQGSKSLKGRQNHKETADGKGGGLQQNDDGDNEVNSRKALLLAAATSRKWRVAEVLDRVLSAGRPQDYR